MKTMRRYRRYGSAWCLVVGGVILLTLKLWQYVMSGEEKVKSDTLPLSHLEHPEFLNMADETIYNSQHLYQNGHVPSRQLLEHSSALANCTPPAIENFPRDFFSQEQRSNGAVIVHIIFSLYMFLGLAIACDEYFVPSLEKICDKLDLAPDVAGATFMAAGSSAPELATAVIGVFVAQDDIGLGAVVGSAVFNIMFVVSICALFAGMVVHLNWWPLFRDCTCYAISIVALVLIIVDEVIHWYEGLVMLILYALYIVLMYFNSSLESWIVPKFTCCTSQYINDETELIRSNEITRSNKFVKPTQNGVSDLHTVTTDDSDPDEYKDTQLLLPPGVHPDSASVPRKALEKQRSEDSDDDDSHPLSIPDGWCQRILWTISLPFLLFMYVTTPDCRRPRWQKWYLVTFFMSCVWISVCSYVMVWMITITGHTLSIPDTIMALTFIAAGVSVPDAITSLIVVKEGQGDMAISNAVGSNVFDILLCMGLPWFIKTAIYKPGSKIEVYSAGLTYSALTLLSTVVVLLATTHLNGWKLNKRFGVILMLLYLMFMTLATCYELNLFGYVHPPECLTNYR